MKKERNSSVELMRILCILMIIAGHYYCHGGWTTGLSTANEIFLKIFGGGSKLAVNSFVIITGYYGKNLDVKRVISLIRDRWFYSVFLTVVLVGLGIVSLRPYLIIQTLFPLLTCRHNYITVFVMLYFLIPFINKFLDCVNEKTIRKLILVATVFLSLIPSVNPDFSRNTYTYLFWMIYLFIIGRELGEGKLRLPWKICFPISIVFLLIATFIIEPIIPIYYENFAVSAQYSFLLLLASVSMVGYFTDLHMPNNRMINNIAKSIFAVYILHDDPSVRGYIWENVFCNSLYGHSNMLWLHFIVTVLVIFAVCVCIDKIYRLTFDKLMKMVPTENIKNLMNIFFEL